LEIPVLDRRRRGGCSARPNDRRCDRDGDVPHRAVDRLRNDTRPALVGAVRRVALLAGVTLICSAHIGSPDVWFDGFAGPYKLLVHVETPPVVPGIATINVRVAEPGITRVTAFVNHFDATGGTPPPDVATPVPNAESWYRTRLWV